MVEKFCDIVPDDTGWIYVVEGERSPSYPCYDLVFGAAKTKAQQLQGAKKRIVLRRLDLSGQMLAIESHAA